MSKSIAILNRTKHILNEIKTLYILYCALIVPYITYCVEVWGHTYKTNLNSIYRLQKKAVRIVKRVDYYEPTNNLFINLHAFTFFDLVDLYSLYKIYNNLLPNCIQRLFIIRESQYNLRGLYMFKKGQELMQKVGAYVLKGYIYGIKELKVIHFANLRKCIKIRW